MRRLLAVTALVLVVGCAPAAPAPDPTPPPGTVPFELQTHCGIHEIVVDGRWYVREGGPLDDGRGNPPAGWENPFHPGFLAVSDGTAVFTDEQGHREVFVVRTGATGPLEGCA